MNEIFYQITLIMIESNIIKRFIVKSFMQNSRLEIPDIASKIISVLEEKFFLNENVVLLDGQKQGKIIKCSTNTFRIALLDNNEIDVTAREITRKSKVGYNDVVEFIECTTKNTAFGRILIENVFEKIAEPGFGMTKVENIRKTLTKVQKEPVKTEDSSKKEAIKAENPEPKKSKTPKLNISTLKSFEIENIVGENLKKFIKVYIFLDKFNDNLGLTDLTVQKVSEAILDPEYTSELACKIHDSLFNIIETDMKNCRGRFADNIGSILSRLPELKSVNPVQSIKKRSEMNVENWKAQSKIFIQNLAKETENDYVQCFMNFCRKDNFSGRLDFLVFLIDIVYFTDEFRGYVNEKQTQMRADKAKYEMLQSLKKKKTEDAEELETINKLSEELKDYNEKTVKHPLRVQIGKYKSYLIFVMDNKMLLKDGSMFYELSAADAIAITKDYDPENRVPKITSNNIKAGIEVLLSDNK